MPEEENVHTQMLEGYEVPLGAQDLQRVLEYCEAFDQASEQRWVMQTVMKLKKILVFTQREVIKAQKKS